MNTILNQYAIWAEYNTTGSLDSELYKNIAYVQQHIDNIIFNPFAIESFINTHTAMWWL